MIKIEEICEIKMRLNLLLICSFIFLSSMAQYKVKRIVTKERGYTRSLEIKWVIKKGEHKGKKHGQYSLSNNGKSSTGKYFLDLKDAEWKYVTKNSKYSEFYTKGKLDSSKGYVGTVFFTLRLDKKGDTSNYETWFSNGISYNKISDTIYVTNQIKKVPIGKLVNEKREGKWNWTTATGKAITYYQNGRSVGTHKSYYNNGRTLCQKSYNKNGNLSGSYVVYYINGDTAMIEHYRNGNKHGEVKSWYDNKVLFYKGTYSNGRLLSYTEYNKDGKVNVVSFVTAGVGTLIHKSETETTKYPIINGLIHGIVTVTSDDSISGSNYIFGVEQLKSEDKCFTQDNVDTSFIKLNYGMLNKDWSANATFPNGEESLQRFIAKNVNFPSLALENDVQGSVKLLFLVDHFGEINSIKTCNGKIGFGLEEESIRVIKATSYLWKPATIDGFPVSMRFRIPITFRAY